MRDRARIVLIEIAEDAERDVYDRIVASDYILDDERDTAQLAIDRERLALDTLAEENSKRLDEAERQADELREKLATGQ